MNPKMKEALEGYNITNPNSQKTWSEKSGELLECVNDLEELKNVNSSELSSLKNICENLETFTEKCVPQFQKGKFNFGEDILEKWQNLLTRITLCANELKSYKGYDMQQLSGLICYIDKIRKFQKECEKNSKPLILEQPEPVDKN